MRELLARVEVIIAIALAAGAIAFFTLDSMGVFDPVDPDRQDIRELIDKAPPDASARIAEIEDHLATGADINARQLNGTTPLIEAASQDATEVVAFLLERGADPNVTQSRSDHPDASRSSALGHAMWGQDAVMIELLLKHGAKTDFTYGRDGWKNAPLNAAVFSGKIELVELLLKYDADVNLRLPDVAQTPLLMAIDYSSIEIIELLLDRGADLNIGGPSSPSRLPLTAAVRNRGLPTIKLLLNHGADVNLSHALHTAVRWATDDVVEYLVQVQGVKLDHIPPTGLRAPLKGNAPLHLAAMKGRIKAAKMLLGRGANPVLENNYGMTPIDIATQHGHTEIVNLLEDASPES